MSEPKFGYCEICYGRIDAETAYRYTSMNIKIHADPNRCVLELHPGVVEKWLEQNPLFKDAECVVFK